MSISPTASPYAKSPAMGFTDRSMQMVSLLQILAAGVDEAKALADELVEVRGNIAATYGLLEKLSGDSAVGVARMFAVAAFQDAESPSAEKVAFARRCVDMARARYDADIESALAQIEHLTRAEIRGLRLASRYVPGAEPAMFDALADGALAQVGVIKAGVADLRRFGSAATLSAADAQALRSVTRLQDFVRVSALASYLAAACYVELARRKKSPAHLANPLRVKIEESIVGLAGRLKRLAEAADSMDADRVSEAGASLADQVATPPWLSLKADPPASPFGPTGSDPRQWGAPAPAPSAMGAALAAAVRYQVKEADQASFLRLCAAHPGRESIIAGMIATGKTDSEITAELGA